MFDNPLPCVYVTLEQDAPTPELQGLSMGRAGGYLLSIETAKFYLTWDDIRHAHPAIQAALEARTGPTIILGLNGHEMDVLKAVGEEARVFTTGGLNGCLVPRHVAEKWYKLIDGDVPHREGLGPAEYWRATLAEILEEKLSKRT